MLKEHLYQLISIISIILSLDYYFINKKYITEIKIEKDLINDNLDKWANIGILGNIKDQKFKLVINEHSINFCYADINKTIYANNFEFDSNIIFINDCLSVYKKDRNIKLTLSTDDIILYLHFDIHGSKLLKEHENYYYISEGSVNIDSFMILEDDKYLIDNLTIVYTNKTQIPILLNYNDKVILIGDYSIWSDNLEIFNWILYEDVLIFQNEKDNSIVLINESFNK